MLIKSNSNLFLFFIFKVIFLNSNALSAQGTMTGGGGGNGVACFDSIKTAELAVSHDGFFNKKYLNKIKSIKTLDYWEADNSYLFFLPNKGEIPIEFLKRIIKTKWMPIANEFSIKLLEALKLYEISSKSYMSNQTIKTTTDIGKMMKILEPHCRILGIINRDRTPKVSRYPDLTFHFDSDLFNLLKMDNEISFSEERGILNQAFLILHEAIYLLGSERGDLTSEETRQIVRLILSNNLYNELEKVPVSQRSFEFQLFEVRHRIDKFLILFFDEHLKNHDPLLNLDAKRMRAENWNSLLAKYSSCTREFYAKKNSPNLLPSSLLIAQLNQFMEPCLYRIGISDAEAFLSVANGLALAGVIKSGDIFITPGIDDSNEIKIVCKKIEDALQTNSSIYNRVFIISEARNYCHLLFKDNLKELL